MLGSMGHEFAERNLPALRNGEPHTSFGEMPTVLRLGPYRFFFFSGDRGEPQHVHVARDDDEAKFWLGPVRLHENGGFRSAELRRVTGLVEANEATLLEAWNGYFGK